MLQKKENIAIYLLKITLISIVFFLLAKFSLHISFIQSHVTLFWLPSGLSIGVLLLLGTKYWIGISIGAFLANYSFETPFGFIISSIIANTLEPLISRFFLVTLFRFNKSLSTLRDGLLFLGVAVFTSPILSALIGALGLCYSKMLDWHMFWNAAFSWCAGDAFGILTLGSLILVWSPKNKIIFTPKRILEKFIFLILFPIIQVIVYFDLIPEFPSNYFSWFIFPVLIWVSIRFSLKTSVTFGFIIILISVLGTIQNHGPFYTGITDYSLILIYCFVSVVMINTLILAVVTVEKNSKGKKNKNRYDFQSKEHKLLEKKEEQLRLALYGSDLGLWDWNFISGQLAVNARWMTMLGLDPDDQVPTIEKWSSLVHPEDKVKLDKIVKENILNPTGKNFEIEIRALHKNGQYIWILDKGGVTERDQKGNPVRITGTHLDITKRIQAEETLHYTEQKFRNLVESTDGIVWEADAVTFQFISVSANAERLLGYSTSEWLEANFWKNHIYSEDAEEAVLFCTLSTTQKIDHEFEYRFIAKDGRIVWLRDIVRVVAENNNPKWLRGILIDITQDKVSRQILDLREKALGAISQGVLLTDISRKITYMNKAFQDITGYNEEEVLGQTCKFLQGKETSQISINEIKSALDKKLPIQIEILNYRKDGSKFWNELSIAPVLDARGNLIQYVGVQKDISEKKLSELELIKAKEEAEAANKIKSDFLNNMSHEIRTPLNAVIGYADLLLKSNLDQNQNKHLMKVTQASNNLLELFDAILDYSNIDTGKLEIKIKEVNIKNLVNQIFEENFPNSKNPNIKTSIKISNEVPDIIFTDDTNLIKIIKNLVSNAFKFTEIGEVELEIKENQNIPEENKVNLFFSVRDTGIGISEDNQGKIFEAFTQIDSSTKRKYGGTGLGISISDQLLKLMQSKLELKSNLGKGSIFYFSLPVYTNLPDRQIQSPEEKTNFISLDILNPYRVLVVDDDLINLDLIKTITKSILPNAIVFEAETGYSGIEIFKNEKPDIIFLDIQMPEMSGQDVAIEIRSLEKSGRIPIIAITAGTAFGNREKCLESGMDDYANKPITKVTMQKLIEKWLITKVNSKI
ncbi:MAG: PAS domain-containing protein [Leptospiraceae bacterium]|nr:PAS domain-containing protein [Leptospiraceae bacterium]